MKKTEIYERVYNYSKRSLSHGHVSFEENLNDNLIESLCETCIYMGAELNSSGMSIERNNFQWYENKGLYSIKVTREYPPGDNKYTRKVEIEIMPPTAKLPKELSDLLKEKGFKKID